MQSVEVLAFNEHDDFGGQSASEWCHAQLNRVTVYVSRVHPNLDVIN